MGEPIPAEEQSNYETFRECLSEPLLRALSEPAEKPKAKKKRHMRKASKSGKQNVDDNISKETTTEAVDTQTSTAAEDLGEFIDVRTTLPNFQKEEPQLTLSST